MGYTRGMAKPDKTHPLFHWRKANGNRSLQSVADEVGCTQSHLSEIENWKNEPSLDLAARLHAHTGIDMKDFVKQSEPAQ
jgi:transcriptional regulator with XRE-family HTH domain